jgi:hypothetical protein
MELLVKHAQDYCKKTSTSGNTSLLSALGLITYDLADTGSIWERPVTIHVSYC